MLLRLLRDWTSSLFIYVVALWYTYAACTMLVRKGGSDSNWHMQIF